MATRGRSLWIAVAVLAVAGLGAAGWLWRSSAPAPDPGPAHLEPPARGAAESSGDAAGSDTLVGADAARGDARAVATDGATAIGGSVLDASSGDPVRRFRVIVYRTRRAGKSIAHRQQSEHSFESDRGTFEIGGLEPGEYRLLIEADGYLAQRVDAILLEEGTARRGLEVRLDRTAVVSGRVVERDTRAPIPGALVVQSAGGVMVSERSIRPGEARTSADGTFEIRGLHPGRLVLFAMHDGFAVGRSDPLDIDSGSVHESVVIVLAPGGGLEGYARGPDGSPFAGGRAGAFPVRGGAGRRAEIEASGYFLIEGLEPGTYRVDASALRGTNPDGSTPGALNATVEVEEGRVQLVDFSPPDGRAVTGRVLRRGEPVAGARIVAVPAAEDPARVPADADTRRSTTSGDGRYRVGSLPAGDVLLFVNASGGRLGHECASECSFRVALAGGALEHTIDLELPVGVLEGRVTRAQDGSAAPGVTVTAVALEESDVPATPGECTTDGDGRYRIRDLRPGRYEARLAGTGTRMLAGTPLAREEVTVASDAPTVLDLALPVGAGATVTVLDPNGRPLAGARVWLERVEALGTAATTQATTDGSGVATWSGVSPGSYRACARAPSHPDGLSGERELAEGGQAAFRIRLAEAIRVRVSVADQAGAPVEGFASVLFVDAEGRPVSTRRAAEKAGEKAFFAPLRAGAYTLIVRAPGYRTDQRLVQVEAPSPQDIVVRLEREG